MEHFYSMDTDELEPIIKPKQVDFDTLSIEELNEYITNLEKKLKKQKTIFHQKVKIDLTPRNYLKNDK